MYPHTISAQRPLLFKRRGRGGLYYSSNSRYLICGTAPAGQMCQDLTALAPPSVSSMVTFTASSGNRSSISSGHSMKHGLPL